jgi:hypothetical protein
LNGIKIKVGKTLRFISVPVDDCSKILFLIARSIKQPLKKIHIKTISISGQSLPVKPVSGKNLKSIT